MQHLLNDISADTVKEEIMLLKVAELKNVCRSIGLPLSGRKMELQDRLLSFLMAPSRAGLNDPFRVPAVNILVKKAGCGDPVPKYETLLHALTTGSFLHPVATGHQDAASLRASGNAATGGGNINTNISTNNNNNMNKNAKAFGGKPFLRFQPSPFYSLKRLIGSESAPEAPSKRGVANISFRLNEEEVKLLKSSSKIRLYLFCGINNSFGTTNDVPIQFPLRNEIKFNEVQIKDNVHGLKNKIGTAKPADLTPYINWPPKSNLLQIVYAFTKDDHMVYVYIVELVETDELLQKTINNPKIVKPATLLYIKQTLKEEEDEDLMTTSTVMSLQCPISYSRMKYPVKSIHCRHLQCFDAQWFIESQKQIPTWQCPVCQKTIHIEDLAICEFVQEIINSTNEDVEQVEISQDGSWLIKDDTENHNASSHNGANSAAKEEATPDIKPEDSHGLISNEEKANSEPIIISLDSDDDEEETQSPSPPPPPQRAIETSNNNSSNTTNGSSDPNSADLNQDNDLLDDEDMAFIEELANSIIDRVPRTTQEDREERDVQKNGPISSASVSSSNEQRHNSDRIYQSQQRKTSLDPKAKEAGGQNPITDHRPQIPNLLGRTPLNAGPSNSSPRLPTMPQLTNADSILFNDANQFRSVETDRHNQSDSHVHSMTSQPQLNRTVNNSMNNSSSSDSESAPLRAHASHSFPVAQPSLPPLPNLPTRPGSSNLPTNLPPSPIIQDPRRKKPEVSPFLPKKNYKNMLPKKRIHSNSSTSSQNGTPQTNSTNVGARNTSPNAEASGPPNDSLHSDDLIDLTSD